MGARCEAASRLRWLGVVFTFVAAAGAARAQEAPSPARPNLEIIKLHWEKQVRLPRNFDPSVISTGGTFNDPASRTSSAAPSSAIDATRAATRAQSAAAGGSDGFPATPGRLPVFYIYSMKLKNVGPKSIEGIAWDYLFFDAANKNQLGAHQFLSYQKIPADKIGALKAQLRSPPTRVVRTADSATRKPAKLIEQSVIQCVLYADDSVWKNPQSRDGVCELLKDNKVLTKRKPG